MNILAARGTRDLSGEDIRKFSKIVEMLKNIVSKDGYSEIKTPIFEDIRLFNLSEDDTLLPNKEFFFLEGKKYVLRPENTAAIVRSVIQDKLQDKLPSPLQFFYYGSYFRYERPQAGRYREFTQFGVEKIGATSIYDDLELIFLVDRILKKFNLSLELHINYLGGKEVKKLWSEELRNYFRSYSSELSEISRLRIEKNPLRILDDRIDREKDCVKNAPSIFNYFSDVDIANIEYLKSFLEDIGIKFIWNKNLVRGIDYYTGFVYEWVHKDLTVIAGGRYDTLFEKFNSKSTPCIGFAIGVERLKNCLEDMEYVWDLEDEKPIYFASLLTSLDKYIFKFLGVLRDYGFMIKTNWSCIKLKDHFKKADRIKADILLIFGSKEAEEKKIIVKCRKKKYEETFDLEKIDDIVDSLRTLI